MLKIEDLSTWLKAAPRSVTTPIRLIVQPENPDTVITIADYGGYPLEVEDVIDVPSFQVRCRSDVPITARNLAQQIDGFFLNTTRPFMLGTSRVIDFGRVGGAPSFDDTDDRGRTDYLCNYWLRIVR